MIRTLVYATVFSLAITASALVVYGSPITGISKVPRIVSSVQFPQTRWGVVKHTIRLQIPKNSSTLSQLIVNIPPGLTMSNQITVYNQSGEKLGTNIAINERKITISFLKYVAPGTNLNIAMKNIKIVGSSNAWLYPVSARLIGINADLPIGIARFRIYR